MSDVGYIDLDGNQMTMPETAIEAFISAHHGPCLRSGEAGYDEARVVWNGMIDKHPLVIAQALGVADVIMAVSFAREHRISTAVRGGGHNAAGNAMVEDGLVIDLSGLCAVRVDPKTRRVHAGGGATIGDVDRETAPFGLAVPLGVVSQTGIAGLTLCGGHSWLARQHGFACDNLVSADLVTADGGFLTVSAEENAELFWALRGGGGNFGVVTGFAYQAHPLGPEVTLCAPFFPLEQGAEIFKAWREIVADAPESFTANIILWSVPAHPNFPEELHGRPVIIPSGVHSGSLEEAADFIKPIRDLAEPLLDISGPIPYTDAQQAFDPFFQKGERLNYWKSIYLDSLPDEVIDLIAARALSRPSPWTLLSMRHMGGAMTRAPAEGTALGGREAPFLFSIDTSWTEAEDSEEAIAWTRDFWDALRPFSSGGVYLNFPGMGDDNEAMLRASYGIASYDRLVSLKTQYDPDNVFRLNQNIKPDLRPKAASE